MTGKGIKKHATDAKARGSSKLTFTFPSVTKYIKPLIGLCLITCVIYFTVKNGNMFRQLNIFALTGSTFFSIFTLILNSLILKWISETFPNPLSVMEACEVTAVGAFANSVGGLPIGTALVIGVLVKKHGIALKDILVGKAVASVLSIAALGLIVGMVTSLTPPYYEGVLFLLSALAIIAAVIWFGKQKWVTLHGRGLSESLAGKTLAKGLALSILVSITMIMTYWSVIRIYMPHVSIAVSVQLAGISLIAGFGVMANSIAGMQEIIVGVMALRNNISFVSGVELGLFIRFSSIIAAALVVLFSIIRKSI